MWGFSFSPGRLCWSQWEFPAQLQPEGPEPGPEQQLEPASGQGPSGPVGLHPAAAGPTAGLSAAPQEPAKKNVHKNMITNLAWTYEKNENVCVH